MFLFILLKCYTDNASFNHLGGGVCLLHAALSQLLLGRLSLQHFVDNQCDRLLSVSLTSLL